MASRLEYRLCAGMAWAGCLLVTTGTWLHPSMTDPADSAAAFAEYAATGRAAWVLAHLAQLAGLAAILVAVVILAFTLTARAWARAVAVLGSATVAGAVVLQAVDGVGLKAMVDRWSAAPADIRPALYAAALAVRDIEIGLDALVPISGGLTVVVFAGALLASGSRTLGLLGLVSGAATFTAGILFALGGYSTAAMTASMGSGLGWIAFGALVGVWAWRRSSDVVAPDYVPTRRSASA
jgi:hypothetical protein